MKLTITTGRVELDGAGTLTLTRNDFAFYLDNKDQPENIYSRVQNFDIRVTGRMSRSPFQARMRTTAAALRFIWSSK